MAGDEETPPSLFLSINGIDGTQNSVIQADHSQKPLFEKLLQLYKKAAEESTHHHRLARILQKFRSLNR